MTRHAPCFILSVGAVNDCKACIVIPVSTSSKTAKNELSFYVTACYNEKSVEKMLNGRMLRNEKLRSSRLR